jgi:hypothetical protein
LDRDHLEISKPRNRDDQAYIGSTQLIRLILSGEIPCAAPSWPGAGSPLAQPASTNPVQTPQPAPANQVKVNGSQNITITGIGDGTTLNIGSVFAGNQGTETARNQLSNQNNCLIEFAALADLIVSILYRTERAGTTYGEGRRLLDVVSHLHNLLKSRLAYFSQSITPFLLQRIKEFDTDTDNYISEAILVLPRPGDSGYTMDRSLIKTLKYKISSGWDGIKFKLLTNELIRHNYEKLRNEGNALWELAGYPDKKAFDSYISPLTEDMLKAPRPPEIMLLRQLTRSSDISEKELLELGFPGDVIAETINSLLRDQYIILDESNRFKLTSIGRSVILSWLAENGKNS